MWEPSKTGKYSIRAEIGIRRVFGDTRPCSDHAHSQSPFTTQIGVGKVIKGWDEGELLSIGSSAHIATASSYPMCSTYTAVPQLSLGEKAVLIATADYVSRGIYLVRHTAEGLPVTHRRMVLVGSHQSFHPTPLSGLKSS